MRIVFKKGEILIFTKKVRVLVEDTTWILPKVPPPNLLGMNGIHDINILEVLAHVALRTGLPLSQGFSLSDTWAWFRYLPALSSSQWLKLRPEWTDLDSHQKTILSDDLGMGFSSCILSDSLGLLAVCPTNYLVSQLSGLSFGPAGGKAGPKKSPDFIGVDSSRTLHIFECKGTQKDHASLRNQFTKGRVQKQNILTTSYFIGERLVSGIFIPQDQSNEDALLLIQDPEFKIDLSKYDIESIILTIILGELGSSLHLIGIPKLANCVANKKVIEDKYKERILQDIDALYDVTYKGDVYKCMNQTYRYDSPELIFGNREVYGIKLQAGFTEKLFMELLNPGDYSFFIDSYIKSMELGLLKWDIVNLDDSIIILTPLGLYIQISVIH